MGKAKVGASYTQGDVKEALAQRLREIHRLGLPGAAQLDLIQEAHAMADELRDRLRAKRCLHRRNLPTWLPT